MRRMLYTVLILVSVSFPIRSQTSPKQAIASPCALTPAQSPAIRGIRLGMSADQLLSMFPGSRENPQIRSKLEQAPRSPYFGLVRLNFTASEYPSSPLFNNVMQFDIQLFDERVSSIWVSYGSPPWNHVDEMIARVAEDFNLPGAKDWNASGEDTKVLKCEGFEISVTAYDRNICCTHIQLRIPSVEQQVRDRREAGEEKARREFKP